MADPGAFFLREGGSELVGYVYTDRPVYRPGHDVHAKAVLRWRDHGRLRPFDRPEAEISVSDATDRVVFRQSRPVDEYGSVTASFTLPAAASLGYYTVRVASQDAQATGSFEVQEYRKPEFEVEVVDGRVASLRVLRGAPCDATWKAAEKVVGMPVEEAAARRGLEVQFHCSAKANPNVFLTNPLHVAGEVHAAALTKALHAPASGSRGAG